MLKGNFRRGGLLSKVGYKWFGAVANFFNTCNWIGITFTPTFMGDHCRLEIQGLTRVVIAQDERDASDSMNQRLMIFERGLMQASYQLDCPYQDAGTPGIIGTYNVHGGGFNWYLTLFQPSSSSPGGQLVITNDLSATLYDSGNVTSNITNVLISIPAGSTTITFTVNGNVSGAVVNLEGYYKHA